MTVHLETMVGVLGDFGINSPSALPLLALFSCITIAHYLNTSCIKKQFESDSLYSYKSTVE